MVLPVKPNKRLLSVWIGGQIVFDLHRQLVGRFMATVEHDSLTSDLHDESDRNRRSCNLEEAGDLAPGQLYSTESGRYSNRYPAAPHFVPIAHHNRLFHAGKIAIITGNLAPHSLNLIVVGLPARGKTHLSVSLARYLKWSIPFPPRPTS